MKKYIKLAIFALSIISFISCEEEESKVYVSENPTGSTLGSLPSFDVFSLDDAARQLSFSWTEADFGFQSSTTYTLQIDSATKNFANPINVLSGQSLSAVTTVGAFNKAMLDAGYEFFDIDHSMEMRVKATISTRVDPVYSQLVAFTVKPYATSFPPIYMCGSATGGWDWTKGVEMRSTAPKVYQTIAIFKSGAFRFFAQADWGPTSYNYPYFSTGTIDNKLSNAGDGDSNFQFTGDSGFYDITVNLKELTVTMTTVPEPVMFITGAAVGGWDWTTNYVQMTWKSNGKFEATTEFISGEAFRFFAQKDWGPTSYNYIYFPSDSIDNKLIDAADGDRNFRFNGTTGNYTIKLNMLDSKITMSAAN